MKQPKRIFAAMLSAIIAAAPLTLHAAAFNSDLNADGNINALDATMILQYAASVGAGSTQSIQEFVTEYLGTSPTAIPDPDLNGDGVINAQDATVVLQYAAAVGTGSKQTIEEFVAEYLGTSQTDDGAWKSAYLETIYENPYYEQSRYALLYMDGDTTPELVIMHSSYGGIYTYKDDSVQLLEGNVVRNELNGYAEKDGMFSMAWISYAYPLQGYNIFELKDGEIVSVLKFQQETTSDDTMIYTIDDVIVTQEEYESRYAEYKEQFTEFSYCSLAEILPELQQTAPPELTEWQAAYLEVIEANSFREAREYALVYIDDDDVPELIAEGMLEYGEGQGSVYTYQNGEAVQLTQLTTRRTVDGYIEKEGILAISWTNAYETNDEGYDEGYDIFRLQQGTAEQVGEYLINRESGPTVYTINGETSDLESYRLSYQEYSKRFTEISYITYEELLVALGALDELPTWQEAYLKWIDSMAHKKVLRYALVKLDGDEIPELVAVDENNTYAGALLEYKKGRAKVFQYLLDGHAFDGCIEKEGIYSIAWNDSDGYAGYDVYSYADDAHMQEAFFMHSVSTSDVSTINGIEYSMEEYRSKYQEYTDRFTEISYRSYAEITAELGRKESAKTWQDAYLDLYAEDTERDALRYALVQMDGDDIPELIVSDYQCGALYTFTEGEAFWVQDLYLRNDLDGYIGGEGIFGIYWYSPTELLEGYTFYRIENGIAVLLKKFEHTLSPEQAEPQYKEDDTYSIDGTEVSMDAYLDSYAEYADRYTETLQDIQFQSFTELQTTLGSTAN